VYRQLPAQYEDLYNFRDSDKAYEKAVQVTGFGLAPVKPEGATITYDSEIQGLTTTYVHIAYALGYIVTYEELRDNLYQEVATNRATANAYAVGQTLNVLGAAIYNDGFTGSAFLMADGQPLLSANHVTALGGNFSNMLSPGVDLMEASLEDACVLLMGMQDDRGNRISAKPLSLHIAPQEWFNAQRILKSTLQSGTANNDINVLYQSNAFPQGVKMNQYFTNPHAWFIRTDIPNGMTAWWRDRPIFDQDNSFDTKSALASTYFRLSFGATDPRGIIGSNGP